MRIHVLLTILSLSMAVNTGCKLNQTISGSHIDTDEQENIANEYLTYGSSVRILLQHLSANNIQHSNDQNEKMIRFMITTDRGFIVSSEIEYRVFYENDMVVNVITRRMHTGP